MLVDILCVKYYSVFQVTVISLFWVVIVLWWLRGRKKMEGRRTGNSVQGVLFFLEDMYCTYTPLNLIFKAEIKAERLSILRR